MKYVVLQLATLLVVAALVVAAGFSFSEERWGTAGTRSMWAAAGICVAAAVIAAVPLTIVAARWPQHVGHAALAGTVVRLTATAALALGYQTLAGVHLTSFLVWLLAIYLPLLTAETIFSVVLVRRTCFPTTGNGQ